MCTLKVRGSNPRLARFALESALRPCLTGEDGWIVNQPSGRRSRKPTDKPGVYGFQCGVSNRAWGDLAGQFTDAVAFIATHREVLLRLGDLTPDRAALDFPAEADPSKRHVIIFEVTVPVDLARASAEVGLAVEITLYFASRAKMPESGPTEGVGDALDER